MARIGFRKAKYNEIDYTTNKYKALTGSPAAVPLFEKVIDEKFAPEYNNAELYADDVLCEVDNTFKKGTITITVADDNDTLESTLLGNTITTNEVTMKVDDNPKEVGYGHIVVKKVGGATKYKVEFFPRVRFNKVTHDAKTRGESVEFSTTTVEGVVIPLDKAINGLAIGTWEKHQTFDTEAAAITYLDGLLTPTATSGV